MSNKSFDEIQSEIQIIECEEPAGILETFVRQEFNCSYYQDVEKSDIPAMARAIEKRGTQFGIYLKNHIFQEHMVRLSVNMHHKHIDEAFPIRLVHGISGTPWHHTPIVDSKKKVKLIYHENEHVTVRGNPPIIRSNLE